MTNIYRSRRWVKPEDLNANSTLFGGTLLSWISEEAASMAIINLENNKIVSKHMSEINFMSTAKQSDIIEIRLEVTHYGRSSITLKCQVFNTMTSELIITVETITMVNLNDQGQPTAHGVTKSKSFL
ncbi:acyl-CoA thioesterase [Flavobacterium sp. JP2137]|uniref:acyl-CoA thioesterase n=1 Tax=Flavobacterium sp. JP2137 TaxID=3414510 RepID=UPI003D2FC052